MAALIVGSRGDKVRRAQTLLKLLGYDPGPLDGVFGPRTERAVKAFEGDYDLPQDGVLSDEDYARLEDAAEVDHDDTPTDPSPHGRGLDVDPAQMRAWEEQVVPLITANAGYMPGRGWFRDGSLLVPRTDAYKKPLNSSGKGRRYGFVCTTWVNFALAWWTRRAERFTPTGGIPSLRRLCTMPNDPPGPVILGSKVKCRGYGPWCVRLWEDRKFVSPLDIVNAPAGTLPRVLAVGQSTKKNGKITKWWHHVALWWRSPKDETWYRIAADGSIGSLKPMDVEKMDLAGATAHDQRAALLVFGVYDLASASQLALPVTPVALEQ